MKRHDRVPQCSISRSRATRLPSAMMLAVLALTAWSPKAQAQSTEPFPAQFNLSTLNGFNGFVLNGIDALDFSGIAVSSAGDVNGDGIDDLIIGAIASDRDGSSRAGESYVVFGSADLGTGGVGTGGSFNLSELNGPNGFVLSGVNADDYSGYSVSSAGDVNGDGIDDLIIGARHIKAGGISGAGPSYVVFGSADLGAGGMGAGGSFSLSELNGPNGFVLNGNDVEDRSNHFVSSAGDVNNDGIGDLIIGARFADTNGIDNTGLSYLVFGSSNLGSGGVGTDGSFALSSLNGPNGFVLNGIDAGDYSGNSVSSAGDVNGDGIDDLIIGAPDADPNGVSDAGESYVVFGSADLGDGGVGTGGSFDLSELNGPNGFVLSGITADDSSGHFVSSAGDVNGDGIDDLIIGAPSADPNGIRNTGESYVVFGSADLGDGGVGADGSFNLSELNGTNGIVLNGIDVGDLSGISVSSAGDVNGDGIDDLVIGAREADPNGISGAGESYVVFGSADLGTSGVGPSGSFSLSALNGTNGFMLLGIDADDRCARHVSSAGDVNSDGIDDLIIGAYFAAPNGLDRAGESYVVFGRDVCWPDLNRDGIVDTGDIQAFISLFLVQDLAADFNGDGILDLGDIQAFVTLFLEGC